MAALNLKSFNNPDHLNQISPVLLKAFLEPWQGYFEGRGLDLAAASTDAMPLDEIARILMNLDASVPEEMVDALYYVHETASHQAMEELVDLAEAAGIEINKDIEATEADVSIQIWLAQPMLLQKKHAEIIAFQRSNFMYFAGSRPNKSLATLPTITEANAKIMQDRMDAWFRAKLKGVKCRIFAFPRGEKIWLLVRRGLPIRREGSHLENGESGITVYRPQQHDVLIYDSESDEICVNARTKGERELYLKTFGAVLFGSEAYFDRSECYSLEPLRELGPEAMAHQDIAGLSGVRLVEFGRSWPGKISEFEIRKADDLFKLYGENWEKRLAGGSLIHATFKFSFEGSERERSVTIRPANIAKYERGPEEDAIQAWLKARGFRVASNEAGGDADFKVLESA